MIDQPKQPAVAVSFNGSLRTYDYLLPKGFAVNPGDTVVVETKHGQQKVTVVSVKPEGSDRAVKPILGIFPPPEPPTQDAA